MLLTIGLDLPRMTLYLIKLSQLKMKNTIDPESIRQELQQYESRLISFRKTVHENPEVGLNTRGTLACIKSILEQFGISGLDTETSPGSGFLLIEGNRPGATVALRADIDALPIEEKSECEWASKNGNAHSCGHDGHQTWLIAAIIYLVKHRDFPGRILCIFQADEENVAGAQSVIDSGVFQKYGVKEIYGAHNEPSLDVGTIAFKAGPTMAACDLFSIRVVGVGTHGARPNFGKDPLPVATEIYNALQSLVSRTLDPLKSAVVSVCSFNTEGSRAYNIISDSVKMIGTVRTFDESIRDTIEEELTRRSQGIAAAYGIKAETVYEHRVSAVNNDPELTKEAKKAADRCFGAQNVIELAEPYMISEDFSSYQKVLPGCFFFIGVKDAEHKEALHSPYFDFNDKVLIPAGAFFSYLALERLNKISE